MASVSRGPMMEPVELALPTGPPVIVLGTARLPKSIGAEQPSCLMIELTLDCVIAKPGCHPERKRRVWPHGKAYRF